MSIPDLAPPPDTGPDTQTAEQQEVRRRMLLLRRAKGGINWFYWVAGLTIINTIIFVTGRIPNYFLGLGVAQLVDGYTVAIANGTEIAPLMHWVAAAMDLLLSSIFLLFGYRGQRSYRSWIVAGIVLYTLDGMVFLLLGVWLGVAFHAFVIYSLVRGLRAMDELNRIGPPRPPREPAAPTRPEDAPPAGDRSVPRAGHRTHGPGQLFWPGPPSFQPGSSMPRMLG